MILPFINVFPTRRKWRLREGMEMLANAMVIIILQYVHVSNQHIVYLKLYNVTCQCYLKSWGKKDLVMVLQLA